MKRFVILSLLASLALVSGGCVTQSGADLSNARIRVRAFIDGCDVVRIRGNQVWIDHAGYELPGRWQGSNEPIILNVTQKWYPTWDGYRSDKCTIEDGDRALPEKKEFSQDTLSVQGKLGLGVLFVSEYPSADNDYTLSVTLDDSSAEGASWYEFGVFWD